MPSPLQKIELALCGLAIDDPKYKAFRQKTTKLRVLGIRVPVLQKLVCDGFQFYNKTEKDILHVWNGVWNTSRMHEAMYLPLFYYRNHKHVLGTYEWHVIKKWIDRVENWEHADALAYLYSILLERYPKLILPTLKKWNRSNNPWKQRISIVSLIYYASKNRKAPPVGLVLKMVEPLIPSKDPYVRKAVGWTLRESYKLYPKETFAFLKKHIQELAAVSFSYATERVTKEQKTELKRMRSRQKSKF
ncbi:hypothetical protein A3C09_02715 [Candidatus Uhrbacteria bacterium RIFCSPHIGHO2_02_FULL_47_44]|uniref:DNA alkylation repair protein n=1 Tax=Candidatus Uhrbacteria bacterium RIFCSPLOWO2_02_FULL_48_18 TaxID=1802408 RepID=A0A1F7V717_9BACT|nr:MAG: hypothetical protein A2839_00115 [Candidatus Uhrbacteria bacterium RIFCSPHIGHO2_01_FULL_47_10]OGL70210.1 MAG: hypothetical protein A3C09_02715 [Candidatus Uhrbacteria bacterium RIFCSPHIGHO2_02_FULL_47_44]OGL77118.1 MAG: hypothetical protein A3E97_03460 [Candidatus Uhrbacteria bacterium RIFCSPHIGHO2_12_FULL_47_12]OGL80459.1 MAG: hypothetical protein A3B20_03560 [Candidatus Uhrbacteria bacterium RIFCSPLOWO2_01_FULL_47_17]OGL86319.1 MAG: hypothetical protein A3I41_02040 [Candidatus Uhrbact